MVVDNVHRWQRVVGVSLRPWSGHSPISLILTGAIHVAVCVIILVFMVRMATGSELEAQAAEMAYLRPLGIVASIALVVLILIGLARILVGIIDFVPRRQIIGTVVRVSDRKFGDILPYFAQRAIFERNANSSDRRKVRTELVVRTESGERQWTVRKRALVRQLRPGAEVRLSVSPLVGHVSSLEMTG